jgi:hypothetical protein
MGRDYFMKVYQKLKYVVADKRMKPIYQIIYELIRTAIVTRSIPKHYFVNGLYRKDITDYLGYLTEKECFRIHAVMHEKHTKSILDNKFFFYKYFDKTLVRIPKTLAYNFGNHFYIDDQKRTVNRADDFYALLDRLITNRGGESIIIKPMLGSFGDNIYKIKSQDLVDNGSAGKNILFEKICSGNQIFQETVMQHRDINKIYAESLNTVRMDTFIDHNGEAEVISAMMRFGRDGRHTDNGSAGGIMVGIDLENGWLRTNGMTLLKLGGNVFTHHPNSGIQFGKFNIPFLNDVKTMAMQAALLLKDRLVGWDIGISENGPVLLEGNSFYHIPSMQTTNGRGYREHPVFKKVISEALQRK